MKIIIIYCLLGVAIADLRQASQPKQGYKLKQQGGGRGSRNFVAGVGVKADGTVDAQNKGIVPYMEPSTFGYQGLVNQRKKNYDNFLRSNIDNEQDNRNFNTEVGRNHLPFRTFESATPSTYPYTGKPGTADDDSLQVNNVNVQTVLRVAPGEPRLTPLRWNNPHASEIEVQLWIMSSDPPTIVPIKKPACSGEGNQNNIIQWAIPEDFNTMAWDACDATKTFTGCNKAGDCTLQIYAHSVETRQYSTAIPIIVTRQVYTGPKLAHSPTAADAYEAKSFAWPKSYDLESMVKGDEPGNPANQGGTGGGNAGGDQAQLANIHICAASEREGISRSGVSVGHVQLAAKGAQYPRLNSPDVHLYLCKETAQEIAAEQLVDQVVFEVATSASGGDGTFSAVGGMDGKRTENYTPFEMTSKTHFGGDGVKEVKATITTYSGAKQVVTTYIDLRGNPKRWRFRRHLKAACPTGLPEPFADPWMDLSLLERETCRSAQDPNANYQQTTLQRAVLHSDVANHAYQNSDYSPYSGQQHRFISRNLQAAAVVHMTSGNRGELGKANIPNAVKKKVKQLNNAVNNIYKNYEKVANKVIDDLTNNGGKNGAGLTLGVQPLGESFRSLEKGATSTKRLKTTTYVPSFDTTGYNMNVVQNAIAQKTRGRKAKYADLLSTPKPGTNRQYVEIYVATMNQMLPDFAAAADLGITYQQSIQTVPCTVLQQTNPDLAQISAANTGNTQPATACCTGSMQNTAPGGCGATLPDITGFRKRSAQGNKDGGLYAALTFTKQRYQALYGCKEECLVQEQDKNGNLAKPVTKTSKGTCIGYLAGSQGCVTARPAATVDYTDCTGCAGIFNNVAPKSFENKFKSGGNSVPELERMSNAIRTRSAQPPEDLGNVLNTAGDPLVADDTAVCHTESSFTCGQLSEKDFVSFADYEQLADGKQCEEVQSVKIDHMCDDGPCDNDSDSYQCQLAKQSCKVDPDSGVWCMPGSENDPCKDCQCKGKVCQASYVASSGKAAAIAFTSVLVFLSAVL